MRPAAPSRSPEAQYPASVGWPGNVERVEHLPPDAHRRFYGRQRLTLSVTRADMFTAGWSPSVRLVEAAACGVPVISDPWDGLDAFFEPGRKLIVARDADDVLDYLDLPDHDAVASAAELEPASCESTRPSIAPESSSSTSPSSPRCAREDARDRGRARPRSARGSTT